jgi:formate C-acetyltransferase
LAKAVLYAINGGRDELTGDIIIPDIPEVKDEILEYDIVAANLAKICNYVADLYV